MQTKYVLPLFASLLALTLGPACSQPEDPSGDDGNDDGNGDKQDVMEQIRDTGPDDKEDTNDDNGGGGDEPDATTDVSGDTGLGFDPSTCEVQNDFTGQIGNSDLTSGGGVAASDNSVFPEDTNLQTVQTTIDDQIDGEDGTVALSDSGTPDPIEVSGSIVTSVEYAESGRFFVQDQNVALYVRSSTEQAVDLKVGDAISFTVTEIGKFGGTPQIQGFSDLTVDSSGNEVAIHDVDMDSLSEDRLQQIVRVGGSLTAPSECGNALCYDMLNQEGEKIIDFRSFTFADQEDPGYFPGTCLTFVGPLGQFDGDFQIQELNRNWVTRASSE